MAIKVLLLLWQGPRWSAHTPSRCLTTNDETVFSDRFVGIYKRHHRQTVLLTKRKTLTDVIYSFCGRLVSYWILRVAREDFCLRRSISRFHCHNARRQSETAVWQMARHLRQHDVARACVCVEVCTFCMIFSPSFFFTSYRDRMWEPTWYMLGRTCAHLHVCETEDTKRKATWIHASKEACCRGVFHTPTHPKSLWCLLCYRLLCWFN